MAPSLKRLLLGSDCAKTRQSLGQIFDRARMQEEKVVNYIRARAQRDKKGNNEGLHVCKYTYVYIYSNMLR